MMTMVWSAITLLVVIGGAAASEESLAVMSDADDTGGAAIGFLDFIELRQRGKNQTGGSP